MYPLAEDGCIHLVHSAQVLQSARQGASSHSYHPCPYSLLSPSSCSVELESAAYLLVGQGGHQVTEDDKLFAPCAEPVEPEDGCPFSTGISSMLPPVSGWILQVHLEVHVTTSLPILFSHCRSCSCAASSEAACWSNTSGPPPLYYPELGSLVCLMYIKRHCRQCLLPAFYLAQLHNIHSSLHSTICLSMSSIYCLFSGRFMISVLAIKQPFNDPGPSCHQ